MDERYALTGETLEALSPRALVDMPEDGHSEPYPLTRSLAVDVLTALVKLLTGAELTDEEQVLAVRYRRAWGYMLAPADVYPQLLHKDEDGLGDLFGWRNRPVPLPGTDGALTWLEAVGRAAVAWANEHAREVVLSADEVGRGSGFGLGQRWHHLLVSRDGGPWEVANG